MAWKNGGLFVFICLYPSFSRSSVYITLQIKDCKENWEELMGRKENINGTVSYLETICKNFEKECEKARKGLAGEDSNATIATNIKWKAKEGIMAELQLEYLKKIRDKAQMIEATEDIDSTKRLLDKQIDQVKNQIAFIALNPHNSTCPFSNAIRLTQLEAYHHLMERYLMPIRSFFEGLS